MKKLLNLVILSLPILLFSNCHKNDSPPPSNTDYITKAPWKFSSAKASGIDVTAQIPSCYKDNTITFVANGTGTINEGADVCVPPSLPSFTWVFQNNGTQINMSVPLVSGGSEIFTVILLNDVNFVVSQSITIPPSPTPVNVEITFVH